MTFTSLGLATILVTEIGSVPDGGLPPWAPTLKRGGAENVATYELRRWGAGYFWENENFEAHVADDGVVTFKDKHGSATVSAFSFSVFGIGKARPRNEGATPNSKDVAPVLRPSWQLPSQSPYDRSVPWDKVTPPNVPSHLPPAPIMVDVSGSFDLTDEIVRTMGPRPYGVEKARFLSATFEFRIKLAMEARKQGILRALDRLPERLDELWNDGHYSARERRRILSELWLEMDRTAEGQSAAGTIEQFIRRRLPCGDPDGYTKDELDALAKQHPGQSFVHGYRCDGRP